VTHKALSTGCSPQWLILRVMMYIIAYTATDVVYKILIFLQANYLKYHVIAKLRNHVTSKGLSNWLRKKPLQLLTYLNPAIICSLVFFPGSALKVVCSSTYLDSSGSCSGWMALQHSKSRSCYRVTFIFSSLRLSAQVLAADENSLLLPLNFATN